MIVEHTSEMTIAAREKSTPYDILPGSIKWIVCFRIHSNWVRFRIHSNWFKSTLMIVEHTSEMTFAARDKSTLMIVEHTRYMTFPTRDKSMPLDMLPDSIKWIVCFRIHSNSSNMSESSRCLILSESDASDKM